MRTKGMSHMWTKEELKTVLSLWESNTFTDIAKSIGVSENQLAYIVGQMKKSGFKFTKKHKNGSLQIILQDLKKEMSM